MVVVLTSDGIHDHGLGSVGPWSGDTGKIRPFTNASLVAMSCHRQILTKDTVIVVRGLVMVGNRGASVGSQ